MTLNPTIAQVSPRSGASAVGRLPEPPALAHYLLENPIPVVVVLLLIGVGLAWMVVTGRANEQRWPRIALIAVVPAALAVYLTGWMVTTERETLARRTRDLVDLAAAADSGGLREVLAPEVSLRLLGGDSAYARDQILDLVARYMSPPNGIDWHKTDDVQAVMDGETTGRTQAHVRVRSPNNTLYDVPVGSWWRLTWRRSGDSWKVSAIECLQIDGVPSGSSISP